MKYLLITGGAGFIGSNFIKYYLEKYTEYHLVNLDSLTYAGDRGSLRGIENSCCYTFVHGDITDRALVEELFEQYEFHGVVHFAAESHVDNSITGPGVFIKTNIEGTFTLLDVAKSHWMEEPFVFKKGRERCRFHHISTDEVYGSLGETGLFSESTPYAPNSPYSASKASSDFLVRAYHHTYGLHVTTSNCSNNYGPFQHDEKLIPTIIRHAIEGKPIPIYGDGKNVRDWLYVRDHCIGIDLVFREGKAGETYNIGGGNEQNNLSIARQICQLLAELSPSKKGRYEDQIVFVKDRAGHDRRYAIDATKLESQLGWQAEETFETGLRKTVAWYLHKYQKG